MNPTWLHSLERLACEGFLAISAIPQGIRKNLEQWGERSGSLHRERQGRGSVLRVINLTILENEIQKIRPCSEVQTLSSRAANLGKYRDTKIGDSRHDTTYYLAKSIGSAQPALCGNQSYDLGALTAILGCFALPIGDKEPGWQTSLQLLLVENQALFDHLDWLPQGWNGMLLYYQGNLSDRLLAWLAQSDFESITLFPDYDGVGLSNYARLVSKIPKARWFWREDWELALSRFGNAELWHKEDQRKHLDALWKEWGQSGFPDSGLQNLMAKIRGEGKMLEQEWVLIT